MYVSADSADFQYHSELFLLDESGKPALVAGVPPDAFPPKGRNGTIPCMIGQG
jgi:4-alpha-glucanotransferase